MLGYEAVFGVYEGPEHEAFRDEKAEERGVADGVSDFLLCAGDGSATLLITEKAVRVLFGRTNCAMDLFRFLFSGCIFSSM